jgi:hypothetical protein
VPELQYSDSLRDVPGLVLVSFAANTGATSSTACSALSSAYSNVDPTLLSQSPAS